METPQGRLRPILRPGNRQLGEKPLATAAPLQIQPTYRIRHIAPTTETRRKSRSNVCTRGLLQRTSAGSQQVQDLPQTYLSIGHLDGVRKVHRCGVRSTTITGISQEQDIVLHLSDLQTITSGLGLMARILGIRNRSQRSASYCARGMGTQFA